MELTATYEFEATPEQVFDAMTDPDLVAKGAELYETQICVFCHGADATAAGMAPDLRASAIPLSEMDAVFAAIVRDGDRVGRGMPGYPELTDAELEALRHYIRDMAHASLATDGESALD